MTFERTGQRDTLAEDDANDPMPTGRELRLEPKDLEDFGFTVGCRKRDALRSGRTNQGTLGHVQHLKAGSNTF